ncbi:hypothetical protein GOODEAATRI_001329 [Goodea atripinnis]|uniref:Secreted protein n=1 Tax=Goodea atripinnis TaxID=208336 RepID=A0ABV0PJZ4_9TELE
MTYKNLLLYYHIFKCWVILQYSATCRSSWCLFAHFCFYASRTTIPGYTGKGVYAPPAAPPAANDTTVSGVTRGSVRAAPLSRMVTTVTPCNPYLSARLPPSRANPRRDVSLVKMGKF